MNYFLFDIDDTLYDLEIPFEIAFVEMFGDNVENLHKIFLDFRKYNNKIYDKALNGEISMEEMCIYRAREAFKDNNIHVSDEDALNFQMIYLKNKNKIYVDKYIEMTLEYLKSKDIPMGIISNGPHKEQFEKVEYLGIEKFIHRNNIIISEDVDYHKPDKQIFEIAKNRISKNPSEEDRYFYIGDAYTNDIFGGLNAGFSTIWINRRDYKIGPSDPKPDFEVNSFYQLFKLIKTLV